MTSSSLQFGKFVLGVGLMFATALVAGCGADDSHAPNVDLTVGGSSSGQGVDFCASPNEGCACETEGEAIDCGKVVETYDEYVICSQGTRTCVDGKWSDCIGETIVQKPTLDLQQEAGRLGPSRSALALGSAKADCNNACDPHCSQVVDAPGGFDAGTGFDNTATGLTLNETVAANCTNLTIAASSTTATVTQLVPSVVAAPIALTATLTPASCLSSPFAVAWTVDRFDIANVTGTNNTNGQFNVLAGVVGNVTVTAYAAGISKSIVIQVKVGANQTVDVSPNEVATPTQIGKFTGTTSTASSVTWLYPYASTFIPLGLLPPVVQYWYSSGSTGGAVKVSLRYPSGSTASTATYNYAMIVKEVNAVTKNEVSATKANTTDPQVKIPAAAWQAFEQTARGNNADLVIQRVRSDGTLELESSRTIRIVDGQLKGTVFYNSYSSQMGGVNTGAVLAIKPGDATPTLAVQPSGKCTVCHTINADATVMIAAGDRPSGGVDFNNSRRYNMSNPSQWPSPTKLNDYDAPSASDVENIPGDKFNYGAVWKDGSLYMTHGGKASYGGDDNWRAPPDYSRLYNPSSPNTALSVTNWSTKSISAVTPKFSVDGKKLAFGFWGASGQSLPKDSGTLSADTSGKTMAVVDFGCSTSGCTGSSTGWKVTNARALTTTTSPGYMVGWPAFTPAADAVAYQVQYRSAASYLSAWSPSPINTVAGALAEIWMSNVPSTAATSATPTRLLALNGLSSSGTSYLPVTKSTFSPSYHAANAAFTINQADNCAVSVGVSGVNDHQLNYLPAMAPVKAAGYNWVVFTSRRMYGNIAYDDPWDAEPGTKGCNLNTAPCTCTSGNPPTKKLWVAAVDSSFTPGTDPSHPAFYLPGQELMAGNSDGYWVAAKCAAIGSACSSSDDCCGGTDSPATARCSGATKQCLSTSSCSALGAACAATTDCCSGLVCGGTGTCVNPVFFATQTYMREYVATCPTGTQPVWRFFEWKATIPTGTSIGLGVQTKEEASDSYVPTAPLTMDAVTTTSPEDVWVHGTSTVDQVLQAGSKRSLSFLLVTMTFTPNVAGTLAPTLTDWRQSYDCLDAE